jgi:hypothetical protein
VTSGEKTIDLSVLRGQDKNKIIESLRLIQIGVDHVNQNDLEQAISCFEKAVLTRLKLILKAYQTIGAYLEQIKYISSD